MGLLIGGWEHRISLCKRLASPAMIHRAVLRHPTQGRMLHVPSTECSSGGRKFGSDRLGAMVYNALSASTPSTRRGRGIG